MEVLINDKVIIFPDVISHITLGQRIDFQAQHGDLLDLMLKSILEMPEGFEKEIELVELQFERCFRAFGFFAGIDPEVLKASDFVDEIASIYFSNLQVLLTDDLKNDLQLSYIWKDEEWEIHPPELKHGSKMTFGEFVDSKQMVKDSIASGKNKWEQLLSLAAIYLRKKGERYQESFMYDDSDRLKLMRELPVDIALNVARLFDELNSFLNIHFSVFQKGRSRSGRNMSEHFDRWGWLNFLKSISKTKEFDIQVSGKNSIDCAREALLFDVLIYASEAKEYNEASNADLEILYKNRSN